MYEILLGLFLIVALALIGLILLQQGKGADLGASFGAGASNTVFGASGSGSFMTKTTWWLALVSLVILLALGYMASHRDKAAVAKDDVFAATPAAETAAPVEAAVVAEAPVAGDVPVAATPAEAAPAAAADVPQAATETPKP